MPAWRERSIRYGAGVRKPSRFEPIDRVRANGRNRRNLTRGARIGEEPESTPCGRSGQNSRKTHRAIDARLAAFQMGDEQNLVARWLRPIGVLRPVVCALHDDVEHRVFDLVIGLLISGEASGEALLYLRVCASSYWVSAQVISTEKRITLVEAPFLTNMKIGTSTHAP